MAGSTISTTVGTGITVGGASYPSPLTITGGGDIAPSYTSGATGIFAPAGPGSVSLVNQGTVAGGGGEGFADNALAPGDGVDFLVVATLTNSGTISGGDAGPYGSPSDTAGVGVDLPAGGVMANAGTIFGGTGGQYGLRANIKAGHGGAGGDGVELASGILTNTGTIIGGAGGAGGSSLGGGFGGNGAVGVDLMGGSLRNSGTIVGGAGGFNGGDDAAAGITIAAGAAATNNATILGGQGGDGGYSPYFDGRGYSGAAGGGAVVSGMLTNLGTIAGGTGGVGGYAGAGEPGVIVDGGTLVAAGTISGGYGGGGGAQVDAVAFQGSVAGTLVLEPGAVFNGMVAGGGLGILQLPAVTSASTVTGLGTEFTGFGQIIVAAGGSWSLPGNFAAGPGKTGVVVAASASVAASGTIAGGNMSYGGAGGGGFMLGANDSLANHGDIVGGVGGYGGTSHGAGNGGVGVGVAANDIFANLGTITGGAGGHDYANANGGAGGDGVDLVGGTLTNIGTITGGNGGREAANGLSGEAAGVGAGGVGVDLTAGASVKNDGTITGGSLSAGAYLAGSTLSNYQNLAGGYRGDGASLGAGAVLTNDATITGGGAFGNGVVSNALPPPIGNGVMLTGNASMINNGTIIGGFDGVGVSLAAGAAVTNNGSIAGAGSNGGLVAAAHGSVGAGAVVEAAATLTNTGTITAGIGADGVFLASGASLDNLGQITSGSGATGPGGGGAPAYGVRLGGDAVVTNDGMITGGSYGIGAYLDGGTLLNLGEIASGQYAAGVRVNGGTLINDGTISGQAAYTVTVPPHMGPGGSYPGGTYTVAARPAVQFGSLASKLVVDPGAVFTQDVVATATASDRLDLGSGTVAGTLGGLGGAISGFSIIAFDPGAAWSVSGSALALGGGQSILGFTFGDTLDLQNELFGVSPTLEPSADALTLSGDGASLTLKIAGANADDFRVTTDAANTGTDLSVQCFREGTRILTARGEVAVEALAVGDLVPTVAGGIMPVRWIGCRRVDCVEHARPEIAWPVRVSAGAFGEGRPYRDLFLSPDHAVFVGGDGGRAAPGILMPVRYLVNGRTVAQVACDAVTYWHVELDRHEVVLAEGMACESYLDTGNRGAFANRDGIEMASLAGISFAA